MRCTLETGVRFPGIRVRTRCDDLPKNSFVVRINDVPVAKETVPDGMCLAVAPPKRLEGLGLEAKPVIHPVNKAKISLIDVDAAPMVEASGISVWKDAGIVALYTASVLRAKAKDFINIQEVSEIIERLEKAYPALVKEVVPKVATVPQLVGVLRRLVEEGVCIRNMKGIIEAIGEYGERDGDVLFLTERARAALGAQLAHGVCGMANQLPVLLLDSEMEEMISSSIVPTTTGQTLVLDPEVTRLFVVAIAKALQPVVAKGKRPVILTHSEVRRFVRKIVEFDLPDVQVLSFDELPAELTIQPLGAHRSSQTRSWPPEEPETTMKIKSATDGNAFRELVNASARKLDANQGINELKALRHAPAIVGPEAAGSIEDLVGRFRGEASQEDELRLPRQSNSDAFGVQRAVNRMAFVDLRAPVGATSDQLAKEQRLHEMLEQFANVVGRIQQRSIAND